MTAKIPFAFIEQNRAYIEDVMVNLFTEKYTVTERKQLLQHLEIEDAIDTFISVYHPKYFNDKINKSNGFLILFKLENKFDYDS